MNARRTGFLFRLAAALFLGFGAGSARADDDDDYPRSPDTCLETQVALARLDFSCGAIDGDFGSKTESALRAFQRQNGIPVTGILDSATSDILQLDSPALSTTSVSQYDLDHLQPLSTTWVGKSQQTEMGYENALQLVAEQHHLTPVLLRHLNPGVDWKAITPSVVIRVPDVERRGTRSQAARVQISLDCMTLDVLDARDRVMAHFPVSIALKVAKRPVGELHVTVKVSNPDYTVDPGNFPESAELNALGHTLVLPPGPRNPVGLAWIGLDRTGYGIHGTPEPARIGRAESHGCFRLTNWDALALLEYVAIGTPVRVER